MHLGALALDRHLIDGNAVGKQLAVERHTALVFFIQAVVIQVGQVDGSGGHFFAVQAVDQLLHKGLGGAAVKGDVMNGKMEDHAAVRDRIEGRTDRDRRVEVERLGVAVDDGDDLFARCGCFFGDLGQLIGEDAHRQAVFFSIVGGERLVRPENCIKRFFDGFDIGALDDGGDIEVVDRGGFVELLLQIHAALGGRQRIDPDLFVLFDTFLFACLLDQQALDHARRFAGKDVGGGDLVDAALLRHHGALDGIAAEGEEIILYADIFHAENRFKRGAERLLHIGFGRDIFTFEAACLRREQGGSVELAVCVDRQLFELDKERRDHIRRQLLRDGFFDVLRLNGLVLHIVGDKIHLTVLVLEVLERRVVHAVGLLDDRFDLTRLHALTVDLDHPVLAVEIDDIAVGRLFDDIAGFEQLGIAVLCGKRVIDKGLGGLLGQAEITVGKHTGKAQLSLIRLLAVFVEDMGADVADRFADRGVVVGLVYLKGERRRSGLGLSVEYIQIELVAVGVGDALAARDDGLERVALLLEHLEHFGADKGAVDLVVRDKIRQQDRVAHGFIGHQKGGDGGAQRRKDTLHRGDKGKRRAHCRARTLWGLHVVVVAVDGIRDARVRMQHALRLAGGTGGIDQQRGVFGIRRNRLLYRRFVLDAAQKPFIDDSLGVAVVADKFQALGRISRRQRRKCGANHPNRIHHGDIFLVAGQLDRHKIAAFDAHTVQSAGDPARIGVQGAVGKEIVLSLIHNDGEIRKLPDIFLDLADEVMHDNLPFFCRIFRLSAICLFCLLSYHKSCILSRFLTYYLPVIL